MLVLWILVTVLLILPAVSQHVKTTCEIPSVEAGQDATLTTYFDINFTKEESTDFYVSHFGHNATVSQVMLRCIFSNGDVECDNKMCCTWERHVTDVFRVYIHNVSQELEGRFWGFVSPADVREQKYCNFTLKAYTCPTHVINTSNSHMTCNSQPITIGQTCTVTCSPGHYFQENQTSVTYTCVGKNKWSPEMPATSCEAYTCPTDSIITTNSHVFCDNQPVTIGQKCTVTCSPGHYFQENHTSLTYTCVGKNKWSPEISVTSCEEQAKVQSASTYFLLLLIVIPIVIVVAILFKKRYTQNRKKYPKEHKVNTQEESKTTSEPLINGSETEMKSSNEVNKTKSLPLRIGVETDMKSLNEVNKTKSLPLRIGVETDMKSLNEENKRISLPLRIDVGTDMKSLIEENKRISLPLRIDVETDMKSLNGPLLPTEIQTATEEDEKYWLECIKKWYPELQSRTYFLPSFHFNRVQYRQQNVAEFLEPVPQIPENSDVCGDRALEIVLQCLHKLADSPQLTDNSQQTENPHHTDNPQQTEISQKTDTPQQRDSSQQKEVMMVVSQFQFGKYLGKPSYAAAATLTPQHNLSSEQFHLPHYDKGDCDVLIIHKSLGLLTLQISSVGGNEKDGLVMKKVKHAIEHLNKAEVVLKNLTPEIKHITKLLVLPNISSSQLQRVINMNPSNEKFLCECLDVQSVADAMKQCLLSDQLSDNQRSSDINLSSLQALQEWWQNLRASRSGSSLTSSLYEQLVARFCGPATTVEVHCVTPPRLNIRTLGEAVSETGERAARLVLFPQQVDILNQSPPQAFLSGPPGTGKTIVLIMQGLTWIQLGYDVHVVSTCDESRAVTILIEHQLQKTAKTSTASLHRHQFDLKKDGEVEAVTRLKSLSEGRQLCVIADEVGGDVDRKSFTKFCDQLIKEVPGVFIWGASLYRDVKQLCLEEFKLTTPLRSPPVVVREVMEAVDIMIKQVDDYTISDVPVPTDGPPIMRFKHCYGQSGHTKISPLNCIECGHEVARVLTELNVGQTGDSNGPPPLQYRDVLVLCVNYPTDDKVDSNSQVTTKASGLVRGLRDRHMPLRVVEKDDEDAIRDMALGVGDLVTVADWNDAHGLERKVVVLESGAGMNDRLHVMSRCTSQLVVIDS